MRKRIQILILTAQTMIFSGYMGLISWAEETGDDYGDEVIDFIKNGSNVGKDPFGNATKMVKTTGASLYQLALTFTVVVMIICFIGAGLRYAWCKGQKREESKDNILAAFVGGTIAFGACSFVLLVKNISGGLF